MVLILQKLKQNTFSWLNKHKKQIIMYTRLSFTFLASYYSLSSLFGELLGSLGTIGFGIIGVVLTPKIQNGKRYIKILALSGHFLKSNGNIDIKAYGRSLLTLYRNYIKRNRVELKRQVQTRFQNVDDKTKLTKTMDVIKKRDNARLFQDMLSKRTKYFWTGIVYTITFNGRSIAGYSTVSMNQRWQDYLLDALVRGKTHGIHGMIRQYLEVNGGLNSYYYTSGRVKWNLVHTVLNQAFIREVQVIAFDVNSLKLAEVQYIKENNLLNIGFNINRGGGGGPQTYINMMEVAYYISLGYNELEILNLLRHKYRSLHHLTRFVLQERISSYWGSFAEAQISLLKPLLTMLLMNKFELFEINKAFRGRFMLERIEKLFPGYTYITLIGLNVNDWESIPDPQPSVLAHWTTAGKPQSQIPINILKEIILRFSKVSHTVKEPTLQNFFSTYNATDPKQLGALVTYQIKNQLGYSNFETAREYLVPSVLIKHLNMLDPATTSFIKDATKVVVNLGYSASVARGELYYLCRKWFCGLTPKDVSSFIRRHQSIKTREDFIKIFISEQSRYSSRITIADINRIAAKYRINSLSYELLQGEGYNYITFMNELQKHYLNWRDAKKQVKARLLIDKLRQYNPIDFQRSKKSTPAYQDMSNFLSSILGYSPGRDVVWVIRRILGINPIVNIDIQTLCTFLQQNSWVQTYSEFQIEFRKRYPP